MKQFNLSLWLKDKSRKVVTRDGKQVRIVCWDAPTKNPIYGFVEGDDGITSWRKDGRFSNLIDNVDLFFADEEDGLTEFEKALSEIIGFWQQGDYVSKDIKADAKTLLDLARKELKPEFDREMDKMLAETDKYNRDSIIALIQWSESFNSSGMTHDKANQLITFVNSYNPYDIWCHKDSKTFNPTQNQAEFEKGKQDALKSLPKWKDVSGKNGAGTKDYKIVGYYLVKGNYAIYLEDLEKLPKE